MPRLATLSLSASEHEALLKRMKKDPDWRVRERAHTLLLIARGNNFQQVAAIQNLCRQTVSCTYQRWLESGLEGLADRARSGAPAKLSQQEVERILQWAREEPLTVRALKARHEEAGGAVVHPNTLRAALKAGGLVWKRTRHSLKKNGTTALLSKQNKRLPT